MSDRILAISETIPFLSLLIEHWDRLASGTLITLQLVIISSVVGGALALALAQMRLSDSRVLRTLAAAWVVCFRGVPLLCLLYLTYYGAGQMRPFLSAIGLWTFLRDAYFCGIVALVLNTSAYQAEIFRAAIRAVPRGQKEAAAALGIGRLQAFRYIILPQAMKIAVRPLGNEVITLVKASALTAVITVFDLMGQTRLIFSRTFDLSIYLWAAIIYLLLTESVRRAVNHFERRANSKGRMVSTAKSA